jgi:hypothetical protein
MKTLQEMTAAPKMELDATFNQEDGEVRVVSPTPITIDEALRLAGVDRTIWMVAKVRTGSWHTTMNVRRGIGLSQPVQVRNNVWAVTVRRRVPEAISDAFDLFEQRLRKFSPRKFPAAPSRLCRDPHVVELALYDHHFGKLSWRRETLDDYDLRIAEQFYDHAFEDHMAWLAPFGVTRWLLPIGNDFFHVNDARNTTPTAENPLDVDGRSAKIFEVGAYALVRGIERLLAVAPVDLVFVPGNHDRDINYYLAVAMRLAFRNHPNLRIDADPISRKYWRCGKVLLGLTHLASKGLKPERLGALMAGERPHDWAATTWHEWHVGHIHRATVWDSMPLNEEMGVRVRSLPCLTAADKWHFDNGFVLNWRASEAFLWSPEAGYRGHFSLNARKKA